MISKEAFEEKFKTMPWKRRQVLEAVVGGKTDQEIRDKVLKVNDPSTVRKHISNLYKDFDIEANGYNCRCELVEIVNTYKPELVAEEVLNECGLSSRSTQEIYIERPPVEARCDQEIVKPGALIRIKAPKRMGKTLLIQQIIAHSEKQSYAQVYLNMNELPFNNLDSFLQSFCVRVSDNLGLSDQLDSYWKKRLPSKVNCKRYLEQYLLKSLDSPVVLCLDEVEQVFSHQEVAEGFLTLLRSWHEDANSKDIWKKLRLIVVYATEVYVTLPTDQSPFNVGLQIDLLEFTEQQVTSFAQAYGLNLSGDSVRKLMAMVGGHPDLLSQAFDYLKNHEAAEKTLDTLLTNAPTEAGIYGSHLRQLLTSIQGHPELLDAVKLLVSTTKPVRLDATITRKLESMGLVQRYGNDCSLISNLYRLYFSDRILGNRESGIGNRESGIGSRESGVG
ncbi:MULTISPECIES: AAA-like domain-containing protein [unclassified Moorena]|uniref:AAA-like domain-containing protein n=1 Tax=unclassified Moorena TaxID=2683338 RepID=UPI001401995C|nr:MULTISPECIES: AAA-like domain-containing protein [unclassified Moorena]NEO15954.1 hypothetical protein [Moorena sp. SIO3E8]NEP99781.1 hypothetical protein [Moorena sp. SIO3F7]